MYGKPTPDTMRQNNVTFLTAYNSPDPPEILFKRVANVQEIVTLAKNPYPTKQLLITAHDLITQCGLCQHNPEDWEHKPEAEQTWINLHPFIQEAYKQRLALGTITSAQGGYAQNNSFAGLTTNDESNKDTANTIAGTITSHMERLSKMTTATINKHAMQKNTSLQQLAANTNQLHQQQQDIINQMAMMTMNHSAAVPANQHTFTGALPPIY